MSDDTMAQKMMHIQEVPLRDEGAKRPMSSDLCNLDLTMLFFTCYLVLYYVRILAKLKQ
jgi:hypothetical protein